MTAFQTAPSEILERLADLRQNDAPTHGGRVLSYVYDSGLAELDELAASAMRLVQPVNGLDPTTFTSVAVMEREVVGFARDLLGGDADVVGSVTTGGTESCLLAVKTARDNWTGVGTPRLLAPVTVHAAFHKAAHYFGLELDLVPVGPDGRVPASALIDRLGADVALVVVSAPSYPVAALDPIAEVAAYRMVQESLTNARLHAPGAACSVSVTYGTDSAVLVVSNVAPASISGRSVGAAGNGLLGMRERAALIGGTLTVGATPDGGWTNSLQIPYPENGAHDQPEENPS